MRRGKVALTTGCAALVLGAVLLAGCGRSGQTVGAIQDLATATTTPTATISATAVPPTATSGTAETTCLPDTGGLFASQAFQTIAAYGLLPAFPNTKHGIGEGHQANGANFDWQTFCSLGTKATLDNLFANALPSLGWKLTTPPANVAAACAWTGPRWWQGTTMLTWSYDGAAGNGSYFWSYTTCALATS